MAISERLTQQKLLEILMNVYIKGMEAKNIHVKDLIEDIKKQILAVTD